MLGAKIAVPIDDAAVLDAKNFARQAPSA
jgi:hypothetical protein